MATHKVIVTVHANKDVPAAQVRRAIRSALAAGPQAAVADDGTYDAGRPIRVTKMED